MPPQESGLPGLAASHAATLQLLTYYTKKSRSRLHNSTHCPAPCLDMVSISLHAGRCEWLSLATADGKRRGPAARRTLNRALRQRVTTAKRPRSTLHQERFTTRDIHA